MLGWKIRERPPEMLKKKTKLRRFRSKRISLESMLRKLDRLRLSKLHRAICQKKSARFHSLLNRKLESFLKLFWIKIQQRLKFNNF